ncbi:MAG: type II toxin-antitoxin system VapC family toxin [Candidatus Solibacter sp.]
MANILEMGVRRGRHDAAFRDSTLADLALLPISIDAETDRQAWGTTLQLSERHRLTLYEAAYLELALRRRLPLGSLDRDLLGAAQAEGVAAKGAGPTRQTNLRWQAASTTRWLGPGMSSRAAHLTTDAIFQSGSAVMHVPAFHAERLKGRTGFLLNRNLRTSTEMCLPGGDNASVDIAKLRDYCLDPQNTRGRHKARVFASILGLAQADAEFLRSTLLRAAREAEAVAGMPDEYGDRFTVDFELNRGDRRATVRSAWIVLRGESARRG